ncbi:MAG: YqgE/AlgH family protein [Chitinophagia bacterium]|nr:YqgE/AlgH family protein [Chitinophagia bacterium]
MISPATGILLIAEPFLKDPHFTRSVALICEHDQEGTVGFVLNKPFDETLDSLMSNFEGFPVPVFYGGPVQINTVHFLHQYPKLIPGGQQILKDIYWGGDFEIASQLIKNNEIDLAKIRFFIGYSGWSKGQLKDELKENTWTTAKATSNLIFHSSPDKIWKDSLRQLGGDYEMMINYPIDPQLN